MRTVVVSDLHIGTVSGRDLLRRPEPRAALAERVRGADHVVLLGDVLELREIPLAAALADAEPLFRELGAALGGARVTIVPGNHDHSLAAPVVDARRLEGADGRLGVDRSEPARSSGPLARLAGWLGDAELRVAYPGLWIRDDVYATHGHYLDRHLAIPTLERLAVAAVERLASSPDAVAPDDYEATVEPVYSLTYSLAQTSSRGRRLLRGGRTVAAWDQLSGSDGRRSVGALLMAGILLPGAVAALNRAGIGPLTADLSGPSLRRSGLRAMATVAANLGVDSGHVLFGHTHRSGPLPADDPVEWELPGGGRLHNTGSWLHEPAFLRDGTASPYWPGTCVVVEDEGPPRLERLLDELPAPGAAVAATGSGP